MARIAITRWTALFPMAAAAAALAGALVLGVTACGRPSQSANAPTQTQPAGDVADPATIDLGDEAMGDGGSGGSTDGSSGGGGSGGGSGSGGGGGGSGVAPEPVEPSPKDCISYDPSDLDVASAGASGWSLRDGSRTMMLFDTAAHANEAKTVVRQYTLSCYIGRGNTRPEPSRYIVQYWEGPSGLPGAVPALECVGYNPSNLTVVSTGEAGWRLNSGDQKIVLLDTAEDAERVKVVAAGATKLCLVGANNSRPDWHRYTMEFWL